MWAGSPSRVRPRCRRSSSTPSRASTSSTGRSAPCFSTTCRPPAIPAAPSRRDVSRPPSSSTASTTTSPIPIATTPTCCRMPPAIRPWASMRCGPCATRSRGSRCRYCCPPTSGGACASRICSAFAAIRSRPRRSFALCTPRLSTATPRRRRPSCVWRPAPRGSAWRAPSALPSAPATTLALTVRASTSPKARAD